MRAVVLSVVSLLAGCADTTTTPANDDSGCTCTDADAGTPDDAAEEVSADVALDNAPPWTPKDLFQLVLWLDADKKVGIVNGEIVAWGDQTPFTNSATALNNQMITHFQYGDPINGHQTIACVGNGTLFAIQDSASLQWGTEDFLIGFVVHSQVSDSGTLWLKDNGTLFFVGINQSWQPYFAIGMNTVTGPSGTTPIARAIIVRGKTMEIRVNGQVTTGPTITTDISNAGKGVVLCSMNTTSGKFAIAEVVAKHGLTGDGEIANLEAYFKQKYALSF